MYNTQFLNLLKEKVVLSDIISKRLKIIIKGRDKVACCPFHKEKTPSFHINDERGFYHCFGCGVHGDVISFLMEQDGLSFKEAVENLAEEYGIELPKLNKNITILKQDIDEISSLYDINEKTCQFFQNIILENKGKVGLNYILSRGLNIENIKKFRIGFAPNDNNNLIVYLKKFGFTEKQMEKAGVANIGDNGYYDKFRNRIIFPVFDKKGKVIAFTGRVIDKNKMPKYMNSPETFVYHKSEVLFNYFFAKKSIYDNKKAILVEGNLDAISLSINGIENVVAPMGTAVTTKQIEELWKITDEIIVCLDGDLAGKKASKRVSLLVLPILSATKNIKFVFLPEGQDPDDLMKLLGKNNFINFLKDKNNCLSLSEFIWKNELDELNIDSNKDYITPEQKSNLEVRLQNIVKQINNKFVAKNFEDFYKKQLFFITKFDARKKIIKYKDVTEINYKKIIAPPNSIENLEKNIIKIEDNIFYLLINQLKLIDKIFQIYNIDILNMNFIGNNSNKLISIFLNIYESNMINDKEFLIKILEKNELKSYIINNNRFNKDSDEKKLKYLYSLILDRNIILLEIEIKELATKNNNEEKRKNIYKELEVLYKKRNDLEYEF